jgi:hypothetical protein
VDVWSDDAILPGEDWRAAITAGLDGADVAILLLSAGFLASRFINDEEVPRLLARRAKEGVRVIPVLLRSCPWEMHPVLKTLQMRGPDGVEGLLRHAPAR